MTGGMGHDAMYGGYGTTADTARGNSGNDLILGGGGDNGLSGGGNNDVIVGGYDFLIQSGTSYTYTNASSWLTAFKNAISNQKLFINDLGGVNKLQGDSGNDTLISGKGDDYLWGGYGNDWLHAGDGDDVLYGNTDYPEASTESDNDTLYGGYGNDTLYGGGGDDVLDGGYQTDKLYGGAGNDIYQYGDYYGLDTVYENANQGTEDVLWLMDTTSIGVYRLGNDLKIFTGYHNEQDTGGNISTVEDSVVLANYFSNLSTDGDGGVDYLMLGDGSAYYMSYIASLAQDITSTRASNSQSTLATIFSEKIDPSLAMDAATVLAANNNPDLPLNFSSEVTLAGVEMTTPIPEGIVA